MHGQAAAARPDRQNIQTSWVKLRPDSCLAVLQGGVNDLGGTLMEETISRMAGSHWFGKARG